MNAIGATTSHWAAIEAAISRLATPGSAKEVPDESPTSEAADWREPSGAPELRRPERQELVEILKSMSELFRDRSINLEFSVDESTDAIVVRVIASETQELVREIRLDGFVLPVGSAGRLNGVFLIEDA